MDLSGKLNSALFNLTSLQYLNLAYNLFDYTPLPQTGFEQLADLTHLNLSSAGFVGQVPIGISTLTNIVSLDLSTEMYYGYINLSHSLFLHDPSLQTLLTNFTKLQVLQLDGVNISSNASEWGSAISQVSSTLQQLSMVQCSLTGPLDGSLIQLKQIKLLKLAQNNLDSPIPIFFAGFSNLSVLSLWSCGLRGYFPDEIFHNLNLRVLDLVDNPMLSGQLPEFTKKSLLEQLYLSNTNFTGPMPNSIGNLQHISKLFLSATNFIGPIPDSIGNLQSLLELDLSYAGFYGVVPDAIQNLTSLTYLSLQENSFTGKIPISLFSHSSLEELCMSDNQFSGHIPEISNGSLVLRVIDLSNNNLQGPLPIFVFNMQQLSELYFGSNNFTGVWKLDYIKNGKNLEDLDLSNNKLSIIDGDDHNKSFYDSFPHISNLYLASCNLNKFPNFLRYQRDIDFLDLSNNKIDGIIPNWVWGFGSIIYLNLSHNLLTKIEGDAPFTSLYQLETLDIHSNMIKGPVPTLPPNIIFADFSSNFFFLLPSHFVVPYLLYLSIANNSLTGEIPISICIATSLEVLDLPYNNLSGVVPLCLLDGARNLTVLNLKSNNLSGRLPQNISYGCGLTSIILSDNQIRGTLPQSLTNCNALEVLDLGNNQISSRFPFWLGNLKSLRVLILRSNQLYGTISNTGTNKKVDISLFSMLKIFDISSNLFNGTLPKSFFENLRSMMTNSNPDTLTISSEYKDHPSYTHKLANHSQGYYQISVTVTYKGLDMDLESSLGILSTLDMSNNGFVGELPEEIGQLKLLTLLNLSHNALTGVIPSQFANLEQLESLDLSFNQLSGHIPQELTSLTFLSTLNLSYNNLVGEIPQGRQFSTFSNNSYLGNSGLCGSPLPVQCTTAPSDHGFTNLRSKFSADLIGLSVSIGVGFGVGFGSVIWALISWENGKKWLNFNVDRFYFRHLHR